MATEDFKLSIEAGAKAQVELEEARRRLSFLSEVSALLASSLDYKVTLATAARLAIPMLADWCLVYLQEKGAVVAVEMACANPAKELLLRELGRRWPPKADSKSPISAAHQDGRARVVARISDEGLKEMARDEEHLAMLRELGPRSLITAPLAVRGNTLGVIALVADDSRRSYTEGDIWLVEELARRAAAAIDNARLYAEAREAIAARDTFLAIASHELKTPLSTLLLRVQLMAARNKEGMPCPPAPPLGQELKLLERNVLRLDSLVTDLLDVTRITSGRLKLHLEKLSLTALVREVVAQFTGTASRAGCPVTIEAEVEASGSWDRMRIEEVVTNLMSNAIKYGSGAPVEVCVEETAETARLRVTDYGIGIAPEHVARLFQRFERFASERRYGGFGLGLWIARQIVEAHGGSIHAESTPGVGSTFTVELPRGLEETSAAD